MDLELKSLLDNLAISYKLHEHKAVFTVGESGFLRDIIPGAHTKNLFMKDDKGRFYLICLGADKRLDVKWLKKYLGVGKLHFGSAEDMKSELHLTPGSVSLFGLMHAQHTRLILDSELWEAPTVSFHANINTETLEITHKDLERFYNWLKADKEILKLQESTA